MKTIIIVILVIVIALALIGGGGSFFEDVEKGAEIVEDNAIVQAVIDKGKQLIVAVFEETSASLDNLPQDVSRQQMEIALRIQDLTDKGKEITASEYKELETLIETYENNWGK